MCRRLRFFGDHALMFWNRGGVAARRIAGDHGSGVGRVRGCGAAVLGVDALGFFELVFEDDDAAGGLDGGAAVDEFAGAGGDPQLVAGVAAVSARGAERGDEAGFADGAEETLRGAEHLGGPAHGVGGVVVVIETAIGIVCCHCTSLWNTWRGPGAVRRQGPKELLHHLPALLLRRPSVSAYPTEM